MTDAQERMWRRAAVVYAGIIGQGHTWETALPLILGNADLLAQIDIEGTPDPLDELLQFAIDTDMDLAR